jgi:hypothetical protein
MAAGYATMSGVPTEVRIARALLELRDLRAIDFSRDLFDEFGWDAMLVMFVAAAEGRTMTDEQVTTEVGAPMTTGIRWLRVLASRGWLVEDGSDHARRVALSIDGTAALRRYLDRIAHLFGPTEQFPHT